MLHTLFFIIPGEFDNLDSINQQNSWGSTRTWSEWRDGTDKQTLSKHSCACAVEEGEWWWSWDGYVQGYHSLKFLWKYFHLGTNMLCKIHRNFSFYKNFFILFSKNHTRLKHNFFFKKFSVAGGTCSNARHFFSL